MCSLNFEHKTSPSEREWYKSCAIAMKRGSPPSNKNSKFGDPSGDAARGASSSANTETATTLPLAGEWGPTLENTAAFLCTGREHSGKTFDFENPTVGVRILSRCKQRDSVSQREQRRRTLHKLHKISIHR